MDIHHLNCGMMHAFGFPAATVHLLADELEACLPPRTLMERWAYLPEHRAHNPKWQPHRLQGDQWFGLECPANY
jgi:hypothetical protein